MASREPFVLSKSARLQAPAGRIYDVIADYVNGHPHILPPAFTGLQVERGGKGAGTRIRFSMKVLGRTREVVGDIEEPEPGRVLVERYLGEPPTVTTFIVDPEGADAATVTIQTEIGVRAGLAGALERFLIRRALAPVYTDELNRLERQATGGGARTGA